MRRSDLIRLRHIVDTIREANAFLQGHSYNELYSNRMLNLSLVRLLEIIGETAHGVSRDCRASYPEIAWSKMAGMRDRIAQGYFDIDLDVVWQTVTGDLPPLLSQLETIISAEE